MTKTLRSQAGFTLIELIIIIIILGLLAAVAIPRYFDLRTEAERQAAKATWDAARAALTLDFASQVLKGSYTPPDLSGSAITGTLNAMMETPPKLPSGFTWVLVDAGSSSPIRPARVSATLNGQDVTQF